MNKSIKKILHNVFLNPVSWKLLQPFVFIGERLKAAKKFKDEEARILSYRSVALDRLKGNKVLHGPFQGMHYHASLPSGSSYYAKLLGSYESEIHPFLYNVMHQKYEQLVNIGCDEGYYAVGLGRKMNCPVLAFDMDKKARQQCYELARLNGIDEKLTLKGKCRAADLLELGAASKILLIVDCEGDEAKIFTKEVAERLVNADIIIELHLHIHPNLLEYFTRLFMQTHEIRVIDSIDDHLKAMSYQFPELEGLDYHQRKFILEEREIFMQWIYLQSKNSPTL